jgi:hypothetical protein
VIKEDIILVKVKLISDDVEANTFKITIKNKSDVKNSITTILE